MQKYSIYCTESQTKKALKLGAPINTWKGAVNGELKGTYTYNDIIYFQPTAEQMLGWLRSKGIQFHFDDETGYWNIWDVNTDLTPLRWYGFSNNKELDAIDAALEYLTNNKKSKIEL